MKIDVNYCFVKDVDANFKSSQYPNNYKDPDQYSKKLYEVLWEVYNPIFIKKLGKITKSPPFYFKAEGGVRYSSDYIGPSRKQAHNWKIDNKSIGETIEKCRTIGGHIIWPMHNGGINQVKARVCDRIDITLLELKDYYETDFSNKAVYSLGLRNAFAKEREWLESFKTFEGFVNAQLLKGSFVDSENNVIVFTEDIGDFITRPGVSYVPSTKKKYREFMGKVEDAVEKRNACIENKMKKRYKSKASEDEIYGQFCSEL